MPEIEDDLDKLARHIANKAMSKDTLFHDKVEAFKAITAYFAVQSKHKKPEQINGRFDAYRNLLGDDHDNAAAAEDAPGAGTG